MVNSNLHPDPQFYNIPPPLPPPLPARDTPPEEDPLAPPPLPPRDTPLPLPPAPPVPPRRSSLVHRPLTPSASLNGRQVTPLPQPGQAQSAQESNLSETGMKVAAVAYVAMWAGVVMMAVAPVCPPMLFVGLGLYAIAHIAMGAGVMVASAPGAKEAQKMDVANDFMTRFKDCNSYHQVVSGYTGAVNNTKFEKTSLQEVCDKSGQKASPHLVELNENYDKINRAMRGKDAAERELLLAKKPPDWDIDVNLSFEEKCKQIRALKVEDDEIKTITEKLNLTDTHASYWKSFLIFQAAASHSKSDEFFE